MKNKNKNNIKKNVSDLSNLDSNFHKINSIMNKKLVGRLDYLTASVYFSRYNENKSNGQNNLEKFFKSKIFTKKPFVLKSNKKLKEFNKKKANKYLNIQINIKDNKINFNKNQFTSPYVLHTKKTHFFKNMVDFSKYIHSESKKENNIKIKYPKLQSISLNSLITSNEPENIFLTPRMSRVSSEIITDEFNFSKNTKKCKSLSDMNYNYFSPKIFNDFDKRIKSSKNSLYSNNDKNSDIMQWKKRLKMNNLHNKDLDGNLFFNYNHYDEINKTPKVLKPNCYYNKLHLNKLSEILKKYSFENKEK